VVSGQAANKNLSSSEKFSLGGPNAVRAYPVGEGAGDEGILAIAEVRYSPGVRIAGGDLGLAAFFDYGYVHVLKNAPVGGVLNDTNKRSVSGAGVGFNLGSDGNFLLRANLAWRVSNRAPASDTVGRHPRVWIQAIQWF
jgi:hemolysin activation/secretion protein